MSTRILKACESLVVACAAVDRGAVAVLTPIRTWLHDDLPRVSRKIATAMPGLRGIQRLTSTAPASLPASRKAVAELLGFMQQDPTRDPLRFAERVDALAWDIAVYRLPEDICEHCQGDLEVWVMPGGRLTLECDFLGCTQPGSCAAAGRVPASRAEVLRRVPDAELLEPD